MNLTPEYQQAVIDRVQNILTKIQTMLEEVDVKEGYSDEAILAYFLWRLDNYDEELIEYDFLEESLSNFIDDFKIQ